jgi:hypothetical protein
MRKITLLSMLLVVLLLNGCGGGGGSSPAACTDDRWLPVVESVPIGTDFTQKSNCDGHTRDAIGTMDTWKYRFGASETVLFKTVVGVIDMVAASDGTSGVLAFGRDSAAKNNKGILTRLDVAGNELWRGSIEVPLGNTFVPHSVVSDGMRVIVMYERLPLHDWYIYGYDMNGNGVISETNINGPTPTTSDWSNWLLSSATAVIDGENLIIARQQQSGQNAIFYASLVDSSTPITIAPMLKPEFVTIDAFGINIIGGSGYMQYDRSLVPLGLPVSWLAPSVDQVIHSVMTIGNETYIAGTSNGIFVLTQVGAPAFRNTKKLEVGTDKIVLHCDEAGNLYVSVGNRFGQIDLMTGEFLTLNPAAVPVSQGFVSGSRYYAVSGTSTIEYLNLSRVQ